MQPYTAATGTRGRSEIEAGVEGELAGGIKAGTLGFVLIGFDLDGGRVGRDDLCVSAVLVVEGGLEAAIVEQINGLGNVTVGQVHIGAQGS